MLRKIKPFVSLGVVLVVWAVMPVVVKRVMQSGFQEFEAPMVAGHSHVKDLQSYWALRGESELELIEAGRDLARINAAYAVSRQQTDSLREEIGRLEALLRLPSRPEFRYEVARVAQRDFSIWWEQLIIRKGSVHGIEPGQAVIYRGGVVGRVREVTTYLATVELVSSPGFRMAAQIAGVDSPITFQGAVNIPMQPPRGEALNIPPSVLVPTNGSLRLESSELGGIFPAGLTIGEIRALEPGPDGYFQRGEVRLPQALSELREVAVIVPYGAE